MRGKLLAGWIIFVLVSATVVFAQIVTQTDPTELIVTMTSADTEYSVQLTGEVIGYSFQCRSANDIRYSWTTGKVATPTDPYTTLKSGNVESFSGTSIQNPTLYFACAASGKIVEVQFEVGP
tara:strand:- start:287 stop:652 length:366 start_codon:yes stop_codon:yes gene_type:complete